jgi:DNA-directed RNA polymerase subunit RPC12/RpoP
MTSAPYRDLAEIEAAPPEAPLLVRYRRDCSACGRDLEDKPWFCRGGRHGFLWLRVCTERRAHLHRRCDYCGARWLSLPVENSDHVKR